MTPTNNTMLTVSMKERRNPSKYDTERNPSSCPAWQIMMRARWIKNALAERLGVTNLAGVLTVDSSRGGDSCCSQDVGLFDGIGFALVFFMNRSFAEVCCEPSR